MVMRNPLIKRIPREIRMDWGKYIALFLFMTFSIGYVSGGVVAEDSMIKAYNDSFEKYNIEDGNMELSEEADAQTIEELEKEALSLYPDFYIEEKVSAIADTFSDSTIRIFKNRTEVNLVCLMKGDFPQEADEIAIDRLYAENNGLSIGDLIRVGNRELKISGTIALPDYSTLFSDNNDSMFDATLFGVGIMTDQGFEEFQDVRLHYSYSWIYTKNIPQTDREKKERADDFLKAVVQEVSVQNISVQTYVPEYANQAIHFTGDDMGGDRIMFVVLLYILIVILGFVFAITTNNTISKEAAVIGTLRASGYSRSEIVRHYMLMPLAITLLSALIGNILGYTFFKDSVASLVYGSYSLTTYKTLWNMDAFVLTTVIPFFLVLVINYITIRRKMSLSPLSFLRRELAAREKKKAMRLPRFRFIRRFRLRIIFQNLPGYVTLFVGICFANVLLLFGMMMTPLLKHYQQEILDHQIAEYQYVLKTPVETDNTDAEKYAAYSLLTEAENVKEEEITVYGLEPDSSYFDEKLEKGTILISKGILDKYKIHIGDTLTLKERYKDKEHSFKVTGIYDYPAMLCVFMNIEDFREEFDYEEGYYNGYFSNEELTDLPEKAVLSTITQEDLTKTSRQLTDSMGNMFYLFQAVSIALYMLVLYILAKVVLEKNVTSISMVKILGYTNREIRGLYLAATRIAVIVFLAASLPIASLIIKMIYDPMMRDAFNGWLPYYVQPVVYPEMFFMGVAAYAVIECILYRKMKKIPMDEALKNVE